MSGATIALPDDCTDVLTPYLKPEMFRALGDPTRLTLLARLATSPGATTVTDLSGCCGVHLSGVSRHLKILLDAGLVKAERQGREMLYRLDCLSLSRALRGMADALELCQASCCAPRGVAAPPGGSGGRTAVSRVAAKRAVHPKPEITKMTQIATTNHEIREQVSQAYTEALARSQKSQSGCCGGSTGCGGAVEPAGVAAQVAGYGPELAEHADAAASSFGCGNPLAFAGVEPGQTVVDLGSGAGFDLMIAARKVGPEGRVIGVDMTDAMIEAARRNAVRAGFEQIEVRKGIIEELPVEDASADWVISNCVINLSPEKKRVFAEIHRVLAPGGRFSISDIVVEELPEAIREHAAAYAACVAGAIPEAEYLAGLRGAGLAEVEVAERHVYAAAEIRDLVASDLESFGLDAGTLDGLLDGLEGKVWSARFSGRKAARD